MPRKSNVLVKLSSVDLEILSKLVPLFSSIVVRKHGDDHILISGYSLELKELRTEYETLIRQKLSLSGMNYDEIKRFLEEKLF